MTQYQKLVDDYFHDAAAYWREIYQTQTVQSAIYERRRAAVLALTDAMQLAPGSQVLEAGCGAGLITTALAQRGHFVSATDNVEAMLGMTRALARESGVGGRVTTRIADINHLQFENGAFDAAVAIGVLPWLQSLDAPVREMARVLKPGGYLIVTVDNFAGVNRVLDPRLCPAIEPVKRFLRSTLGRFRWPKTPPRARTHSIRQLDRAIGSAGLKKLRGCTIGFGPFTLWGWNLLPNRMGHRLNNKLQRMADRGFPILRSAGAHYVVVAQKAPHEKENHAD